jgi:hypothetical protein
MNHFPFSHLNDNGDAKSEIGFSSAINWYGFSLSILTNTWLGSKLVSVANKIILLGSTYCTLYNPNHFLVNFPKCDLLPFGNHKTKSPNLNCFFLFFCWFHKVLLYCWVPNLTLDCSLFSYNFFNSNTLLVKIFTIFFVWLLPMISKMYSIGIEGCNPCTN